MDKIRFMVVSGFLGAGKTTTMIALAEHMNKTFGETAIIANDLGANLVDTNLTQTSGCTVAEIASGCICYQMDNTVDQIRRLRDKDGAVFVMSDIPGCGVGALDHVYHRLANDNADEFTLSPFTVVVDPERLRMIMPERADINLPEELVYLLKLQLEEADLVVLNKADLLAPEDVERYVDFLHAACPDIPVLVISALERTGIEELAEFITTHETALKNFSVRNNQEFADAEAKLTWYNRRLYLKTNDGGKIDCNAVVGRPHREHPHGPHREEAQRAASEDVRHLGQWRLQQGVAHRRGLRRRICTAVPAPTQEPAHDRECARRVRVATARTPHGRRARRGVREVRPRLPGVLHGMLRHGRRRKVTFRRPAGRRN